MNATLQYFKEKATLAYILAEFIKNLWENIDDKIFSPIFFKEIISRMNPQFKGIAANDLKI